MMLLFFFTFSCLSSIFLWNSIFRLFFSVFLNVFVLLHCRTVNCYLVFTCASAIVFCSCDVRYVSFVYFEHFLCTYNGTFWREYYFQDKVYCHKKKRKIYLVKISNKHRKIILVRFCTNLVRFHDLLYQFCRNLTISYNQSICFLLGQLLNFEIEWPFRIASFQVKLERSFQTLKSVCHSIVKCRIVENWRKREKSALPRSNSNG